MDRGGGRRAADRGLSCVEGAMTDVKSGCSPAAWRGYSERVGQVVATHEGEPRRRVISLRRKRERPAAAPTLTSIRNVAGSGIGSKPIGEAGANDSGPNSNSVPTMIVKAICAISCFLPTSPRIVININETVGCRTVVDDGSN